MSISVGCVTMEFVVFAIPFLMEFDALAEIQCDAYEYVCM